MDRDFRGKVNGWYVRRGDPAGLTIEESLAYYAYEPVQNNRIEHFLGLAQTQNCDVIGFCDERPCRYPHAAGSGHHDDCQRLTFYRGHMRCLHQISVSVVIQNNVLDAPATVAGSKVNIQYQPCVAHQS